MACRIIYIPVPGANAALEPGDLSFDYTLEEVKQEFQGFSFYQPIIPTLRYLGRTTDTSAVR